MAMGAARKVFFSAMFATMTIAAFSAAVGASSSREETFARNTIASHEIVIFSKSYCPYCKRAKAVFRELKKEAHVIELDHRDDGAEIQDALRDIVGRRTVPQVFIKGKHIGGSDDTVEAYQSGELAKLLGITSEEEL